MMSPPHVRCILATNEHGHYAVPISGEHRPAAKAILTGLAYEPETLSFIMQNCAGRDVIHAGTYFGDFLPALSKAIAADALLWAFEPNPESYACASWTVRLNGIANCRLHNAGLAAEPGLLPLYTHCGEGLSLGGASTFVERPGRSIEATLLRIDDVVGDRPTGIIQLDLESFEEQALTGALQTIRRNLPIIILETPPSIDWWSHHMAPLGYTVFGKVHRNTIYRARI